MTLPNDTPADTELRQEIGRIFLSNYTALHDDFWKSEFEAAKGAAEEVMQLIKARDADNEILIREEYWNLEFALDEAYDNGALKPDLEDAWIEFNKRKSTPTDQKEKE